MESQELLRYAILEGDLGKVKAALSAGSDVNTWINGRPPTSIAIENGQVDIAIHLIKHGADLSLPPIPHERGHDWRAAYRGLALDEGFKYCMREIVTGVALLWAMHYLIEEYAPSPWSYHHLMQITWPFSLVQLEINSCFRPLLRSRKAIAESLAHIPVAAIFIGLYCFAQLDPTGDVRPLILSLFDYSPIGLSFRAIISLLCAPLKKRIRLFCTGHHCTSDELHRFRGWQIVTSYLKVKPKSEKLLLALLDRKLFPRQYVWRSMMIVDTVGAGQSLPTHLWRLAAERGYDNVIRRLVDLGVLANFNVGNELTGLCIAARNGKLSTVKTLLEVHSRVDGLLPSPYSFSTRRLPLLECLTMYDSEQPAYREIAEHLIDHGADVQLVGVNGKSALHLAAESCELRLINILLKKGADPSLKDDFGKTPGHYAFRREDADEVLKALRQKRSTPHEKGRVLDQPFIQRVEECVRIAT